VIDDNAVRQGVLDAANVGGARQLVVAIPDAFEAGQVIEQARRVHPLLPIVARAHSDDEVRYLSGLGADSVIMGEREIARGMIVLVDETLEGAREAGLTPA
jgi:CPA2 family monovalent cation:H+ antiporter-2